MPDTPSITIRKAFTYRGVREEYHNKYHFSGTVPGNTADWRALALAIWNLERANLVQDVEYVGYLGHEAGNEFAVANEDFLGSALTGRQGSQTQDADPAPGDAAIWVRWATDQRNSRGTRIYLRKFFHGFVSVGDTITSGARAGWLTYASGMKDGTLPGGAKICGPQGAVAGTAAVSPYVGFRQLKRTGKRPSR